MTALVQGAKELAYLGDASKATTVLLNRNILNDLNGVTSAAGAAQATNTTGVKNANTINYLNDGVYQSGKTATDPLWTLTGGVLAAGSVRVYLLCIAAGTASVIQSSNDAATAAGVQFVTVAGVADAWNGLCIVSTVQITTDATHTFTPGTTSLTGTGITAVFADGPGKWLYPLIGGSNGSAITNAGIGPVSYLG